VKQEAIMADQNTEHQAQERAKAAETHKEATKKRLAEEKEAREKAHAEQRGVAGEVKPTPTQEENDMAALGVHIVEHEPDGSPPDPGIVPAATDKRQIEGKPASRGAYQTRTTTHD
jgi:hypothetical protein